MHECIWLSVYIKLECKRLKFWIIYILLFPFIFVVAACMNAWIIFGVASFGATLGRPELKWKACLLMAARSDSMQVTAWVFSFSFQHQHSLSSTQIIKERESCGWQRKERRATRTTNPNLSNETGGAPALSNPAAIRKMKGKVNRFCRACSARFPAPSKSIFSTCEAKKKRKELNAVDIRPRLVCAVLINSDTLTANYGVKQSQFTKLTSESLH